MTAAAHADLAYKKFAAPISVQSCRVEMAWGAQVGPHAAGPLVSGVAVKFVNEASVVATRAIFKITYNGRTEAIADNGKFSPGITIDARFNAFDRMDYWRPEPDGCSLAEVDFADGTVWRPTAK